jgi:hypothetical protein
MLGIKDGDFDFSPDLENFYFWGLVGGLYRII